MRRHRLLLVVNDRASFLARRADVALGAHARGFDVHVAWPSAGPQAAGDLEFTPYTIEDLERRGVVTLHPIAMERGARSLWNEFNTLWTVIGALRSVRADIVHSFTLKPAFYVTLAVWLVRSETRVINSFVGLGYLFTRSGRRATLVRRAFLGAYGFLARRVRAISVFQNDENAAIFRSAGALDTARVHVTQGGSGVDLTRFRASPSPDGPPVVVLPSRLLWDKGVAEYVEAARALKARWPQARFLIAGGLDQANPASVDERRLTDWVAEGVVEWLGYRADMENVYRGSTIVCLPSYAEGVPRSLMEAAASGRPIVTTDVPGCRDVVRHDDNGLLVPPRDAQRLAAALESLIADPMRAECMGQRGRARAEAEFSLQRVVSNTIELYEQSLAAD